MTGVEDAVGDDIMTGYRWVLVTYVTLSNPHPSMYTHTGTHTLTTSYTSKQMYSHTQTRSQRHTDILTNVY